MSRCVPNWDLEDPPNHSAHLLPSSSSQPQRPLPISEEHGVAELTWENGQLSAQGLVKPTTTGTLESVVDQANKLLYRSPATWRPIGPHNENPATMLDALVPTHVQQRHQLEEMASAMGSCSSMGSSRKRARRVGPTTDSMRMMEEDFGFATSASAPLDEEEVGLVGGSPDTENSFRRITPKTATNDDHDDSFCRDRPSKSQRDAAGDEDDKVTDGSTVRSTISTKRSRATAVHNQSERKRRDRINQKMRTLQKLVPSSSKTDKASMLDEVIEYLKQLKAQVQMMSRMGGMMMPLSMQQFQMIMMAQMAQMGMGMGMGMGMMDMTALGSSGPARVRSVLPAYPFNPFMGGSHSSDQRMQHPGSAAATMPDPLSAFVPCPTQQQIPMDAYQRMSIMYQQMFQQAPLFNPE